MIDKNEIQKMLNSDPTDNIICHTYEFRPSIIASDIKRLANKVDEYGFIIIGVSVSGNKYYVNGISKGIKIQDIVAKALKQLTVDPSVESESLDVNGNNIYVIKVNGIAEGTSLIDDRINNVLIKEFVDTLYSICIKLQGNAKYIDATEDERNDYVRDMLEQSGYNVKDQTRRGLSSSRISSGEIDIFVEKERQSFTVIEALNLKSLDKTYLSKHLDKIYLYDTTGNVFNVCLVYAEVKDFSKFCEKYSDYVKAYNYPYKLVFYDDNIDNEYTGSEIKIMKSTHNRSGKLTLLFHICVKIILR